MEVIPMKIEDLKLGDIVLFGRARSSNGEITPGVITKFGRDKVMVWALERRGRPPKPVGAIWTCHPSVIRDLVVRPPDGSEYVIPNGQGGFNQPMGGDQPEQIPLGITEQMKITARRMRVIKNRKETLNAWKKHLPADRDIWYWTPGNGRVDRLCRIKRVNQKTITIELVDRNTESGEWMLDRKWSSKITGSKSSIDRYFQHKYQGSPANPCTQTRPF